MRPEPAHPREVVFELGELDLQLAVGRMCVTSEDVQNHRGPVNDWNRERFLEVPLLAWRQLVVADDHVCIGSLCELRHFFKLARPEVSVRVDGFAALSNFADNRNAGRLKELIKL